MNNLSIKRKFPSNSLELPVKKRKIGESYTKIAVEKIEDLQKLICTTIKESYQKPKITVFSPLNQNLPIELHRHIFSYLDELVDLSSLLIVSKSIYLFIKQNYYYLFNSNEITTYNKDIIVQFDEIIPFNKFNHLVNEIIIGKSNHNKIALISNKINYLITSLYLEKNFDIIYLQNVDGQFVSFVTEKKIILIDVKTETVITTFSLSKNLIRYQQNKEKSFAILTYADCFIILDIRKKPSIYSVTRGEITDFFIFQNEIYAFYTKQKTIFLCKGELNQNQFIQKEKVFNYNKSFDRYFIKDQRFLFIASKNQVTIFDILKQQTSVCPFNQDFGQTYEFGIINNLVLAIFTQSKNIFFNLLTNTTSYEDKPVKTQIKNLTHDKNVVISVTTQMAQIWTTNQINGQFFPLCKIISYANEKGFRNNLVHSCGNGILVRCSLNEKQKISRIHFKELM